MKKIRAISALILAVILAVSALPFATSAAAAEPILISPEMDFESDSQYGYRDAGLTVPATHRGMFESQSEETLPASYDMRVSAADHLPPVRDQNPYGMCWTFSAMASSESSLIDKGLATNSIDLSEMHLSYYTYKQGVDPMGLSSGDYNYISNGYSLLNIGGNSMLSTYTLARWFGVAPESALPYDDAQYTVGAQYPDFYSTEMDVGHLQNSYWINLDTDADAVKRYIMEQGIVGVAYYEDGMSGNSSTHAYYQSDEQTTNHAVAIVGWDDNYSKNNFLYSDRPEEDGAWLIRNSYGTGDGDGGYFWLSYYDASLTNGTAYVFDVESADNYDYNYQYDGGSGLMSIYVMDTPSALEANVFTSQQDEMLEAISFAIPMNTNVDYEVDVYLNPTNPSNPTSGTRVAAAHTTGSKQFAGYHTVTLANPVALTEGTKFSVVVYLSAAPGEEIKLSVDRSRNYGPFAFHSDAQAGQSFYSFNGGSYWTDEGASNGGNVRIKAFTTQASLERPTGLTAANDINTGVVTLNWDALEGAQSYEIEVMSEDEQAFAALSSTSSTTYSYSPTGFAGQTLYYRVRAVKSGGSTDWSAIASVRMPVTKYLYGYQFDEIELTMAIGDTQQLHPSFDPPTASDKKLSYYSDNSSVASVSSTGLITATGSGSTLIHAISRSGGHERSIPVYVPREIQCTTLEQLQSAHNYANSIDEKYIYRSEGAASITVTFSADTELTYYDIIRIYNGAGELKGTYYFKQLSGQAITVTGDTFVVRLTTDYGSTAYGFRAESITTSQDTNFPTSISVATMPNKTSYFVGDTFDSTGLTLTANYTDGSTKTITEGFACAPSTLTWAGTQAVTVSYGGKTTTFNISVLKVEIASISVTSPPTQTAYFRYDSINTAGLVVTANYNNGTTQVITEGYTLSETYFPEIGTFTITVTYAGATDTFDITVEDAVVTGIHIVNLPTKLEYNVGDMLDTTGMMIWADYNDGYPDMDVTEGFNCTPEFLNRPGTQTITVWYMDHTTTFEVTVVGEVEELAITASASTLRIGGSVSLTAAYKISGQTPAVTWSSSNPSVASVDATGKVTGKRQGNVMITASDGTITASLGVQVLPNIASLSIFSKSGSLTQKVSWWKSYSSAKMYLGYRMANIPNAAKLVWSSSNSKVIVSQSGVITNTGLFSRSSTITLRAYDAGGNMIAKTSVVVKFHK